ncbi:unnamed protein product [Dimorphilus gyrociliatus]|uniref:Uncharacterized protein n=1 Tax=Dimorphilus gyrociliatus TaxID=2664684 RepID=A0A7I8VM45_9ANNE|nr:unnamed protein product [Dimorphilus gyrociliatus]
MNNRMVSMEKTTKKRRKTTSMLLHHEERELEKYRQSLEMESKERLSAFRRSHEVFVGKYGHNLLPAWAPTVSHQLLNDKFSRVVHSFLPEIPNSRKVSLVSSSFPVPKRNVREIRRTMSMTNSKHLDYTEEDTRRLLDIDKFLRSSLLTESLNFQNTSRSNSIEYDRNKDGKLFKTVAMNVIKRQSVTRAFLSTLVEESEEEENNDNIGHCYLNEAFRTLKDCRYLRLPTFDNKT